MPDPFPHAAMHREWQTMAGAKKKNYSKRQALLVVFGVKPKSKIKSTAG